MTLPPLNQPVTLGIIGYGIMGQRLLGAAMAFDPDQLLTVGVWDPSAEAMAKLAADFPDVPRLGSAAAVIAEADCLYIAAPPAVHLDYAAAAFAADKAVFCEKPLAVDLDGARRLAGRVEAVGYRAAVNFPFTSSFAVDQIIAWLRDGVIGTPQRLEIEVGFAAWPRPWQRDAAGWLARRAQGGFTREVVSHFLFLTRRLFGPLALGAHSCVYPGTGDGSETAIAAALTADLPSGTALPVLLKGTVGETDLPEFNRWTLIGDRGQIRLRDWAIAERWDAASARWQEAPDAMPIDAARPLVLRRQLEEVVKLTRAAPHRLATIREALEVQQCVETILADGKDGQG